MFLLPILDCVTMMPTSRIEASKNPFGRTFQEFPTTWKYPHTTFMASNIVPPVSPLAHLIIVVYKKSYPVHESHVALQTLKESVWSEVRELSLPKPTESCYPQRLAAYNSGKRRPAQCIASFKVCNMYLTLLSCFRLYSPCRSD